MATFKKDIHLGTKVPVWGTSDYNDKSVTEAKLANGAVTNKKLGTDVQDTLGYVCNLTDDIDRDDIDTLWKESGIEEPISEAEKVICEALIESAQKAAKDAKDDADECVKALGQWEETKKAADEAVENANEAVTSVTETANNALALAETANKNAADAKTIAQGAADSVTYFSTETIPDIQEVANTASSKADDASNVAYAASELASSANEASTEAKALAKTAAEDAAKAAHDAVAEDLDECVTASAKATTTADVAYTSAVTSASNASSAQTSATNAEVSASKAQEYLSEIQAEIESWEASTPTDQYTALLAKHEENKTLIEENADDIAELQDENIVATSTTVKNSNIRTSTYLMNSGGVMVVIEGESGYTVYIYDINNSEYIYLKDTNDKDGSLTYAFSKYKSISATPDEELGAATSSVDDVIHNSGKRQYLWVTAKEGTVPTVRIAEKVSVVIPQISADLENVTERVSDVEDTISTNSEQEYTTLEKSLSLPYYSVSLPNGTVSTYIPEGETEPLYWYSDKIKVTEGDVLTFADSIRYITAYADDTAIEAKGYDSGGTATVSSFTVPEGINYIVVTLPKAAKGQPYTHKAIRSVIVNQNIIETRLVETGCFDYKTETLSDTFAIARTGCSMLPTGEIRDDSSSYTYYNMSTEISVQEGDVLTTSALMRFICAFAGTTARTAAGSNTTVSEYTVPSGITKIVVTLYPQYTDTQYTIKRRIEGVVINSTASDVAKNICLYKRGNLSAGGIITIGSNDVKSYKSLQMAATVGTMGTFTIGHGDSGWGASWAVIGSTNIVVHNMTGSDATQTFTHGLTISGNIFVKIEREATTAKLTISSLGQEYTTAINWNGENGDIFLKSASAVFTNVSLSWTSKTLESKVWIFGDSYISLGDTARWPYYMIQDGHTDILLNGHSGGTSSVALTQLSSLLDICKPEVVVWALGMNETDTSAAVNSDWQTAYTKAAALCANKAITFIPCTIPTAAGGVSPDDPTQSTGMRINKFKNAVVRASGYRYIDFDKAVGASETTGFWYNNETANDLLEKTWNETTQTYTRIHPTALGAKVLYQQAVADCPEIVND